MIPVSLPFSRSSDDPTGLPVCNGITPYAMIFHETSYPSCQKVPREEFGGLTGIDFLLFPAVVLSDVLSLAVFPVVLTELRGGALT